MSVLEEYKKSLKDENLTDEQVKERYLEEKRVFDEEVEKKRKEYQPLDMDAFIKSIGGQEKIEQMKDINAKADNLIVVNGKVQKKEIETKSVENLEEWKRGFMEGFEEAYKRIHGDK